MSAPRGSPASEGRPDGRGRQGDTTVGDMGADRVAAVGHARYERYVQQVEQRDAVRREVAATRTKARVLIGIGFATSVVGLAAFASSLPRWTAEDVSAGLLVGPDPASMFGPPVLGVPLGSLGWWLATVGVLLMVVGGVLHVVVTARRHRIERDMVVRLPWEVDSR
jgi:hypothetical protein